LKSQVGKGDDKMKKLTKVFFLVIVLVSMTSAQQKLYVNNMIGLNVHDGLSPINTGSPSNGPKASISNAIAAAINGTIIYIAATGIPYNENPVVNKVIPFVGYSASNTVKPVEINLTGGDMVFNPPGNGTITFNVGSINGPGYNFPAASRFQFRGTSTKGFYLKSGYVRQGNAVFYIIPHFRDRR
jgi:hypothetical protein